MSQPRLSEPPPPPEAVGAASYGRGMSEEWADPPPRRMAFDLPEEHGRHVGHADLLLEAVDGRSGEDPDHGWLPSL